MTAPPQSPDHTVTEPPARPGTPRRAHQALGVGRTRRLVRVRARMLTVTAIAALGMGGAATAAVGQAPAWPRPAAHRHHGSSRAATRAERPDRADWETIEAAAHMRSVGLAPDHTAHFRAFAGYLGLSGLVTIHPLAAGPCRDAVTDLYDNLLDLADAYPGETWGQLRRIVATEPSIRACAPRRAERGPRG
jgi:hypothetical protein